MNKKRVLLYLVSLLFLSTFLIGVVSAQVIFDPVKNMFTEWEQGQLSVNIAKYAFWMLLLVVIYGVAGFLPGFERNNFLKFVFSLIVSFLATAYLTPSDVYTALASYTALGLVLSAIIPFVVLLIFSLAIEKKGGVGGAILSKFVWFAFIVFLIYKIVSGMFFCNIGAAGSSRCIDLTEGWAYIAVIVISLIWVFWVERAVFKWLFKAEIKAVQDKAFQEIEAEDIVKRTHMKEYSAIKKRVGKEPF